MANEKLKDIVEVGSSPVEGQVPSYANKTYDKTNPLSNTDRGDTGTAVEPVSVLENGAFDEITNRPIYQLTDNALVDDTKITSIIKLINQNGVLEGFEFVSATANQIQLSRGTYILDNSYFNFINYVYKGKYQNKTDNFVVDFIYLTPDETYYIWMDSTGNYIIDLIESGFDGVLLGSFTTDGSGNFLAYTDLRKIISLGQDILALLNQEILARIAGDQNLQNQINNFQQNWNAESGYLEPSDISNIPRAKDFILIYDNYIPTVPVMTSNTSPSGVASSDSTNDNPAFAYKVFDGNDSTYFTEMSVGFSSSLTRKIWYEYGSPIIIKKVRLKAYGNGSTSQVPVGFTYSLIGWDGIQWVIIQQLKNLVFPIFNTSAHSFDEEFIVGNSTAYSKYGIQVDATNGGGGGAFSYLYTIQFYRDDEYYISVKDELASLESGLGIIETEIGSLESGLAVEVNRTDNWFKTVNGFIDGFEII